MISAIMALLLLTVSVCIFFQRRQLQLERAENARLLERLNFSLTMEGPASPAKDSTDMSQDERSELLQLRGEVGSLGKLANQIPAPEEAVARPEAKAASFQEPTEYRQRLTADIQHTTKNLERALQFYNAGQISLNDVVVSKKHRFEFLTGEADAHPDTLSREQLVNQEISLDKSLVEQAKALESTNSQAFNYLEEEILNLEREQLKKEWNPHATH